MTPFNPCAVADIIPTLLRRTRQGKIKGKILRLFAHKSKPHLLFYSGGNTNNTGSNVCLYLYIKMM